MSFVWDGSFSAPRHSYIQSNLLKQDNVFPMMILALVYT